MIDEEMFVRYKRPRKNLKQRRRHSRAGGSIFDPVIASSNETASGHNDNLCEGCGGQYHDDSVCQIISLRRIADALEAIEAKLK